MTFDFRIITIGYSEPTLWIAVSLGTAVAVLVGASVGRGIGGIQERRRRRAWGGPITASALLGLAALPVLVLHVLFPLVNGGAMVCSAFVRPALLVPAVVGLAVEWIAWRQTRAAAVA